MPQAFKRVILFGKHHRNQETIATLMQLQTLMQTLDITVAIETETASLLPQCDAVTVDEKQLHQQGDLIIVVGGDGSLLNAARVAIQQNLPVLGINRGRLGFLTDIPPDNDMAAQVTAVLAGHYQQETRFLLQADIAGTDQTAQIGLNDIVLLPGESAQMIEFSIHINGNFVCTQRADGLIIATPTGSTAYALSGGGPILHPELAAIVLVPMFPHKLTSRPVVIAADSHLEITLDNHLPTLPRLSADGQPYVPVAAGQTISIRKIPQTLHLIHPLHYRYFATLRNKLQWESKPYH